MDFKLVRSRRKTCAIHISPDGQITVKAPLYMPKTEIIKFIDSKKEWIQLSKTKLERLRLEREKLKPISKTELKELSGRAASIIPPKVEYYAAILGVNYGKITIRHQKTRWGSCSGKGNLNFNCLLMLAPDYVIDYVIVHELCHRKHMNHSSDFWAEISHVLPSYKVSYNWLKKNGGDLIHRMLKNE